VVGGGLDGGWVFGEDGQDLSILKKEGRDGIVSARIWKTQCLSKKELLQ